MQRLPKLFGCGYGLTVAGVLTLWLGTASRLDCFDRQLSFQVSSWCLSLNTPSKSS